MIMFGTTITNVSAMTTQEKADNLFQNAEILAPMVRASTTPLRLIALSYGADLVYTEEIIDRSITATDRIVNDELKTIDYVKRMSSFSAKVQRRMRANNETQPVVLRIVPSKEKGRLIYQMGTGESNLALPAATMVANDVDGIDINMGCPKKFSVSGGMGSALLSDLPRACDIIKTLRRNLNIPVSCKIRLLENELKTVEFIKGLVDAGANAITIHGRMVGDESTKPARLDRLVETVKLVKSSGSVNVPVIINGDLYTRNDMINLKTKSGADGVMLARPALYNTSIFRKPPGITSDYHEMGEEIRYGYDSPLLLSKTRVIQDYLTQARFYKTHHKNAKYVICEMMNNRRTPSELTPFMPQKYPGDQSIDMICKCKSIDDLCKVWDVKTSFASAEDDTETTLHRYDDRYFLDPNALRQEQNGEIKNDSHSSNGEKNPPQKKNCNMDKDSEKSKSSGKATPFSEETEKVEIRAKRARLD